jgi:hypothetical protein
MMSREQQEKDNVHLCPSCVSFISETNGCRRAYQWLVGETTICREYANAEKHAAVMKMAHKIMDRDRDILEQLKDN